MKKINKLKKFLLAISTVFSIFTSSFYSFARETESNVLTFIPSRSYYAKYISENSSLDSDMVQYVWLKLFSEETNWHPGQTYYSPQYDSWAHKYYSDYVGSDGIIHSSYKTPITYNPEFDSYLYQTLNHNEDFIINWINSNPSVFQNYCKTVLSHPIFARAIIDLTSGANANSNYLGNGQYAYNNLFLRGAVSTGHAHKGNGSGAKWSLSAPNATGYDIDILRVFGNYYHSLNPTQKAWVRTYFSWMIQDYITNRNQSLAAETTNLLNMISVSAEAFGSSAPQLFFDHCINSTDANVGEFIANSALAWNQQDVLYTGIADVSSNTDMSVIWDMSDGDCYYNNSGWAGHRNVHGQAPDNDYDWLCYRICFDNNSYWAKLRGIISNNPTTKKQMENWIMRYNAKTPSSGTNDFADAVAHAGQTVSEVINTATWSGCGRSCPEEVIGGNGAVLYTIEEAYDCGTHGTNAGWSVMKPLGVRQISFDIPTSGKNVDSTVSFTLKDAVTNETIAVAGESKKTVTLTIPAKYVWISTLKLVGTTYYRDGNEGHVGKGSCDSVHEGTTTINFTYANVDACVTNNHEYGWTYNFYDSNNNLITADNTTTIPSYCLASGVCSNCGHRTEYKDNLLNVTKNGSSTLYSALFSHSSAPNLGAKSHTVYDAPNVTQTTKFAPNSNAQYLSASSELKNFGYTNEISRVYDGDGNAVQMVTSANGTVALKSGAIGKGAKSIRVCAVGHENTYRLMNPITGELKNSRRELVAQTGGSTCTWDLSEYSDLELEGVYVVVDMYSRDENWGGHALGETVTCSSTVQFNYIEVKY